MYVYIHVYIHAYAYKYTHMYICTYVCVCVSIYAYAHVHMYVERYRYRCIHTDIYDISIYICTYMTYMCVCVCTILVPIKGPEISVAFLTPSSKFDCNYAMSFLLDFRNLYFPGIFQIQRIINQSGRIQVKNSVSAEADNLRTNSLDDKRLNNDFFNALFVVQGCKRF